MDGSWVLAVLGVVVVEAVLSGTWNRLYFTAGLPIYSRQAQVLNPAAPLPAPHELAKWVSGSWSQSLTFREVGTDQYGFREKVWDATLGFVYTPVMHGLLVFDRPNSRVRVTGFVNWASIAFPALVIAIALQYEVPWFFLVLPLVLEPIMYAIQAHRFARVASVAASAWSNVPELLDGYGD